VVEGNLRLLRDLEVLQFEQLLIFFLVEKQDAVVISLHQEP